MTYVAAQIVLWMVAASLFGFIVGWIGRGRRDNSPARRRRKKR